MCIDYPELNKVIVANKYQISVIEKLLDELHGETYLSKIDFKYRYHKIREKEDDVNKMAFLTHEWNNEFLVIPFELINTSTTF